MTFSKKFNPADADVSPGMVLKETRTVVALSTTSKIIL